MPLLSFLCYPGLEGMDDTLTPPPPPHTHTHTGEGTCFPPSTGSNAHLCQSHPRSHTQINIWSAVRPPWPVELTHKTNHDRDKVAEDTLEGKRGEEKGREEDGKDGPFLEPLWRQFPKNLAELERERRCRCISFLELCNKHPSWEA